MQFDKKLKDFGFTNLLVSGCSFTSKEFHAKSWPYWVQLHGGVDTVHNLAWPGAGNYHIYQSTLYYLETHPELTSENTLVVIMWSGYDRDDLIATPEAINKNSTTYTYNENAKLIYTGGITGSSNSLLSLENVKKVKNLTSRSIENFGLIVGLFNYLENKKFKFMFTEFATLPNQFTNGFDPCVYLPESSQKWFRQHVRTIVPNLGDFSKIGSSKEAHHPTEEDHNTWTQSVLLPHIFQLVS